MQTEFSWLFGEGLRGIMKPFKGVPVFKPSLSSKDSTASVHVLRKGFSRLTQDVYFLPVEISDNGLPSLSSTQTLTVRVCSCDSRDTILSCNVEPYVLPAGLSTGALIAILACIVILLGTESTNHSPPLLDLHTHRGSQEG